MSKKAETTKDLSTIISSRLKKDTSKNVTEWVLKHNLKTEDGIPYEYSKRRYLIDFLNDMSPQQSVMASAQLGKTNQLLLKVAYLCEVKKLNVAYSLPTQELRDKIIKSKANRMIELNPHFKSLIKGDISMKQIGDRMSHYVYTHGTGGSLAYTVDVVIADEVSRSNPEAIANFKTRTLNSEYRYEWYISNPMAPHDILHEMFLESDQKHWMIKCSRCNKKQILNWDGLDGMKGNLCRERKNIVCVKCDEVLRPDDIVMGEWIKKYQNRKKSGYWMHQLMRPMITEERQGNLVEEMIGVEKKEPSTFFNFYMGLPYAGSDVTLDKALFLKHTKEPLKERPKGNIIMGCDIGDTSGHHYMIASGTDIFKIGIARSWAEIEKIYIDNHVEYLVVDNMPEKGPARQLQEKYPQFIWRNNYVGNREDHFKFDSDTGLVHTARHVVFDSLVKRISDGEFTFHLDKHDPLYETMATHFASMTKIAGLDGQGNPTFKWETAHPSVPDHFAHGFLYLGVALEYLEMMRPQFGVFIPKEDKELPELYEGETDPERDSWLDY